MKETIMERYRNARHNEVPTNEKGERWCVCGGDRGEDGNVSGGVLEWCYGENDANMMIEDMKKYQQFSELKVMLW